MSLPSPFDDDDEDIEEEEEEGRKANGWKKEDWIACKCIPSESILFPLSAMSLFL